MGGGPGLLGESNTLICHVVTGGITPNQLEDSANVEGYDKYILLCGLPGDQFTSKRHPEPGHGSVC